MVYVVDCGKAKETSYDALNKLACLLPSWISKASSHQVGKFYYMFYSKLHFWSLNISGTKNVILWVADVMFGW